MRLGAGTWLGKNIRHLDCPMGRGHLTPEPDEVESKSQACLHALLSPGLVSLASPPPP